MLGIASTVSTTGVFVFILLSSVFFMDLIRKTRYKMFYTSALFLTLLAAFIGLLPFLLMKFSGEEGASVSFLSRYYDFIISLNLFYDNLFFGYGFGSQIENAIPYGQKFMGIYEYMRIRPTGADGLTMLIAQCGIFSLLLLSPIIFPKYYQQLGFFSKSIISLSIVLMFNTENFMFILIFTLLSFYGVVGDKNIYKSNKSCVLK